MSRRDADAFEVAARCAFGDAFLASLAIDMQTRRLTLGVYGALHGGTATQLATLMFFGVNELVCENDDGRFPESVHVAKFDLSYDDDLASGRADLRGARGWRLGWSFEGIAFEERAATIASLADDDADAG